MNRTSPCRALTRCLHVYCFAALVVLTWPLGGWLVVVVLLARYGGRAARRLTTLGSARWADRFDLSTAGMLGAASGLILGRLLPLTRRWWQGRGGAESLVRLSRAVHVAVFGPTGIGKGVSLVIPHLLTWLSSAVVLDFKSELHATTAAARRRLGQRVVCLNPFGSGSETGTGGPDSFNPLDTIDANHPLALDDCTELADAIVVRPAEEREPHWNDCATEVITAVTAVVVVHGTPGKRSLHTVREILADPRKLDTAIQLMRQSTVWNGALATLGSQLLHFVDKEKASVLSTALRHLRFLATPAVAACTASSSFDPAELRQGTLTVYCIVPPDRAPAMAGLLRMWACSFVRAGLRSGVAQPGSAEGEKQVCFVLDEMATLGHLNCIDSALSLGRGYGLQLHLYFQSVAQTRRCFPDGQDQTLLANTTQVFLGVNDNATADYVSARLGDKTIVLESGGSNHGGSTQHNDGPQGSNSRGTSWGESTNWQQQARRLLKPEEVIALSPRTAITFAPACRRSAPTC